MTTQPPPESAEPAPKCTKCGSLDDQRSVLCCLTDAERAEPAPAATDTQAREGTTALRGPLTTKGTRVRVNLPESENHGAEGHIVAHDAKAPEWRVQFDESLRNDGDVWFRTDQLVPVGDAEEQLFAAISALSDEARASLLSRFWSPTEIRAVEARAGELHRALNGDAEVSHEQARGIVQGLVDESHAWNGYTTLLAYVSQCEARQQQAAASFDALRSERDHYVHEASRLGRRLEQAEREVAELRAGYPDACDKFQDQIRKVAAERDALRARVAELRKELQSTWNKMKRQQENLSGLNATIQGWVTRATHAEEQVKKMGLDNLEKLARHAKLTDELRAERERLQARVAELEASKERLRESRRCIHRVVCADCGFAVRPEVSTSDDVRAIARAIIAEVAERAAESCGKVSGHGYPLAKLAQAAKEENDGV